MPAPKRTHYFHADASALGGYLQAPVKQTVPLFAPLSLAPAGGYGSANAPGYRLEGVLSFEAAYAQVSGVLSEKEGRGWVTLVSSVVEGLNVLDVVTADRVVAQISTEHPLVGNDPAVTFLGTQFVNLKIAGHPVNPILDLNICDQPNGDNGYPDGPCVADKGFLARVEEQYCQVTNPQSLPQWVKDKSIPDWLEARYRWKNAQAGRSSILCSIVKATSGEFPGTPFGHVLDVPDFGRVYLGQLIVDCRSFRLMMIHLELGCIAQGQVDFGNCVANGGTIPP